MCRTFCAGVISTNLMRHQIAPGSFFGGVAKGLMNALAGWGGTKSIEAGAATSIYAAVSPDLDGKSGALSAGALCRRQVFVS